MVRVENHSIELAWDHPVAEFLSLRGGTTVTRSPNSLASTEYAPGPRKKSAAKVNILIMWTTSIGWSTNNRFATAATQAIIVRIGVKKPKRRLSETRPINETTDQCIALEEKLNRCARFNATIPAAAILKRSSPIPGPP